MIKIEKVEVVGWDNAIRGMRNPMESWEKSDSEWRYNLGGLMYSMKKYDDAYFIGESDIALMKKLAAAGSDHRKFMRMIVVYADITAPLYWYKEYDTYKVGTVANSCSTMHKIHAKPFTREDFSCERMTGGSLIILYTVINQLEAERQLFVETKNPEHWDNMIQLLPTSYNQRRTVMLNYEVLRNMYHARKAHKLSEWREFCRWIEALPYSELIIGKDEKENEEVH